MNARFLTAMLALIAVLAIAMPASAQLQRGAIYGTVMDNTGAVLPGVTVTLSSNVKAPQSVVSGSQGEFRFGELDPGTYTITASLQGFAPFKRENVVVNVGSNVQLPVQMALQGVQQQVTVTAATPILDERTHGNNTTFGEAALNEVPTARDPWVLLQQVPGVLVDRVNVGGSESGQQSTIGARGDNGTNTMWNIDGVTITDMGAIGSSPTYYDFDVFQEVQFSTGGTDPREQTGALGINMVTKRGTNDFHGLARYFFDNHNLQSDNLPSNLPRCPAGTNSVNCYAGNQINQIADYGGDIGGPIVKNKLWFWGSASKNDIRNIAITGAPDNTQLKSYAAKVDFQATASNHANFFYYRGDKVKFGRSASATRPPETTVNQGGPTDIYKIEDSHTFGQHFLVTGRYAHVSGGFFLTPQGGLNANVYNDTDTGVWHGSYYDYHTDRPQDQVNVDSSYFRGMHELKAGFQYRKTPITSQTAWPNDAVSFVSSEGSSVTLTRRGNYTSTQQNTSFYVGDTVSLSRVTLDLAVRYDHQNGFNQGSTSPANVLAPAILPTLSTTDSSHSFTWNSWSPRAGATFRLNDKTNVRASYALYQGQLPSAYIALTNPVILSGITYGFADDGSHVPTASNIDFSKVLSSYGFDPANPTGPSPNSIDPNFKAPKTHSVIVALDREVAANFGVSTSFGYGYSYDLPWDIYPGLTSADFVPIGSLDTGAVGAKLAAKGLSSSTVYYGLAPGVPTPVGEELTNRQGYHQRYWNWDVTATKRLADRWMMRGYVTLSNNQEYFDNPALAIQDPTPLGILGTFQNAPLLSTTTWIMANQNGGIVPTWGGNASGSKQDVYMQSKWAYSLMGLYQFGWGIQGSGTVYGHQGYPNPLWALVDRGAQLGSQSQVLLSTDLEAQRQPNIHMVDLRAQKAFTHRGVGAILSVDCFNVFNNNSVLQIQRQVTSSKYGQVREIVSPRIFRVGARFTF